MKLTPQIVGAVALVGMAGALAGAAIGESPVLARSQSDTLPTSTIVTTANASLHTTKNLPDHYPLQTPAGTVEVADLALRGRLRNQSTDVWWDRQDERRAEADGDYDFYLTASPEEIEHERRLLAFYERTTPAPPAQPDLQPSRTVRTVTRAEAPMALAEPAEITAPAPAPVVATRASVGNSRTVDVAATLAIRD